jgi:hypothetical protein
MAKSRIVDGFIEDTARPGIRKQTTFNLDQDVYADTTTRNVGSAGTGCTATEYGNGIVHTTVLAVSALDVTMTDAGAAGCHGTSNLYTFPVGGVTILGATGDLTLTAGAGGIGDTAAAVWSVGTVAVGTDNATLTTTEADIISSTASTLVAGVKNAQGTGPGTVAFFNGTSSAKVARLNIAVPDADSSASDTFTVAGTVNISWLFTPDV